MASMQKKFHLAITLLRRSSLDDEVPWMSTKPLWYHWMMYSAQAHQLDLVSCIGSGLAAVRGEDRNRPTASDEIYYEVGHISKVLLPQTPGHLLGGSMEYQAREMPSR